MSLLRRIQDATIDPKFQLADILRMCKILAARLDHKAFNEWIDQELNGYKDRYNIPNYRILENLQHRGNFSNYGYEFKNYPIPLSALPESARQILAKRHIWIAVSSLENSVIQSNMRAVDHNVIPWEVDTVIRLEVYEGTTCSDAWTVIPISEIVSIIDTIKNRVLDFIIEIEAQNPDAGDVQLGQKPVAEQVVTSIFHNCILQQNLIGFSFMSENYTNNLQGANVANMANTVKDNARQQANQHIHLSEQKRTLAEAANEIQQLIQQLEQTNPTATEAEKVSHINDETTPSFKRRVSSALQASGETAIDEFILENKYLKVVKASIKGWAKPN
jgi:hypothetical protein